MLRYQYRWFYVFLLNGCVLFLAYFYLLAPSFCEIQKQQEMLESEKNKIFQLRQLAHQLHQKTLSHSKESHDLLARLQILLRQYPITLHSIHFADEKNAHVILHGPFSSFVSFVHGLAQQSLPLWMTDFSYQSNVLDAQIHILDDVELPVAILPRPSNMYQPFCGMAVFNQDIAFTVTEMRMVGFLQQGNKRVALLSMPTGQINAVTIGDVIGVEHVAIKAISPTVVVLQSGHLISRT